MTFLEIYYELISFKNLEQNEFGKKKESHGLENIQYNEWFCMFCGGSHPEAKFTQKSHAISEAIGNKLLFNYLECQDCNLHFGKAFEDSLGKYTAPFRFVSHIFGKKNTITIKDMPESNSEISYKSYRMEINKCTPIEQSAPSFNHRDYIIEQENRNIMKEVENGFILDIPRASYNPRLVYLAFLKMAYSILPLSMFPSYSKCILMLRQYAARETPFDNVAEAERYLSGMPCKGLFNYLPGINPFGGVNVYLYCNHSPSDNLYCNLLFRMDFYNFSITIPVLSDEEFCGGGDHSFHMLNPYKSGVSDVIDFTKEERSFRCKFSASKTPIDPSQYEAIAAEMRKQGLLKQKKEESNANVESSDSKTLD